MSIQARFAGRLRAALRIARLLEEVAARSEALHARVAHEAALTRVLAAKSAVAFVRSCPPPSRLSDVEFRVFSQFGDDGIIQYLVSRIAPTEEEETFVEFGVEDYTESNTRFLLVHDNWRGLILDCSDQLLARVRASDLYWRHDLTAIASMVDRDNINGLLAQGGMKGRVGLLSIDIDGVDYWVWQSI